MNSAVTRQDKLLLLIVDDNMYFVERMVALLEETGNVGYINVASDYEEARHLLNEEEHDLVILDINLPGKNGIELLRQIKQPGGSCKVIMVTNHADEYYRQQCKELGADYFLDKSNDFGRVPMIVSSYSLELNS